MKTPIVATLTAFAALAGLTGCSGPDEPSVTDPFETACRAFVLDSGSIGDTLAKQIISARRYGWDRDEVRPLLERAINAASDAGRTAGLTDEQFALFADLVIVLDSAGAALLVDGDDGPTRADADAVLTAYETVNEACA